MLGLVAGWLLEDVEKMKRSDQFIRCVKGLDVEACENARNEFENNIQLGLGDEVVTITQRIFDFTGGFYNGIQKNASEPSNCVKSLVSMRLSWEKLFNGLTFINFETPINFIFNFNEFVQKIDSSYGLCTISTAYNIFHPSTIPLGLNSILTRWLANKDKVHNQFSYISQNLTLNDYSSVGISFGVLFTYLTGFQIK